MSSSREIPSTVSWQSAFWALVAIAINSLLQPVGRIGTFSTRTSFFLRVSPIMCAADAISSLYFIISYACKSGKGLPYAARVWRVTRTQPLGDDPPGTGPNTTLQASQPVRLLAFVLGTLPQCIKLFACTGIPWTQTWAYMFILSFLVLEIIILLSRTVEENELSSPEPDLEQFANQPSNSHLRIVPAVIIYFAVGGHVALLSWALFCSIPPLQSNNLSLWDWWQAMLIFSFLAPLWGIATFISVFVSVFAVWFPILDQYKYWCMDAALSIGAFLYRPLIILIIIGIAGQSWWIFTYLRLPGRGKLLLRFILPYLCSAQPTVRSSSSLGHTTRNRRSTTSPAHSDTASIEPIFILLSPLACLLWYALKYNPAGTGKPGWTEKLG